MSILFPRWCHQASRSLSSRGTRFSFSQLHQLLAAALGHATYASFRASDLHHFDSAKWALVSAERMAERARELGIALSSGDCFLMLADLQTDGGPFATVFEDRFTVLDPVFVIDLPHSAWTELAQKHGVSVLQPLPARAAGEHYEVEPGVWRRRVTGEVVVDLHGAEARMPYSGILEGKKLGLNLYGPMLMKEIKAAGPVELRPDASPAASVA